MAPAKKEETLHDYLRRHFEQISRAKARQLTESSEIMETEPAPAGHGAKTKA